MSRRGRGPPPIPLLHHGPRLSDRDFEAAYGALDEYVILEALDDDPCLIVLFSCWYTLM